MIDFKEAGGAKYLYTLYTDGTTVYYGVDAEKDAENRETIGNPFPVSYEDLKPVFENGENLAVPEFDLTNGECLITSYAPLVDFGGEVIGAVGVDYDATDLMDELTTLQMLIILIVLLGCTISMVIL